MNRGQTTFVLESLHRGERGDWKTWSVPSIACNASNAYNAAFGVEGAAMTTLTIRNLDERLKGRLRVRAATRGRSMEEEARQILRAVLNESEPASTNLAERIRRRFAKLGDVQFPIAAREPVRHLEMPEDIPVNGAPASTKAAATKARRRP